MPNGLHAIPNVLGRGPPVNPFEDSDMTDSVQFSKSWKLMAGMFSYLYQLKIERSRTDHLQVMDLHICVIQAGTYAV